MTDEALSNKYIFSWHSIIRIHTTVLGDCLLKDSLWFRTEVGRQINHTCHKKYTAILLSKIDQGTDQFAPHTLGTKARLVFSDGGIH